MSEGWSGLAHGSAEPYFKLCRFIDHVMVYHTGIQATVEIHIVMDENLPLKVG